jgi:Trypsin-like peptidase domain
VGVPLADRVVEVIADLGEDVNPRYRYGSGCIVRARTVLTAAHVVLGAQRVSVRRPDKVLRPTLVDPRFVSGDDGPDLALVEIDDETVDLAAIELAVVDRSSPIAQPVEHCHAVGYPWFGETPSPKMTRDTVDAYGFIPVLSKLKGGLLSIQVSNTPRPLPRGKVALVKSQWQGMSGAPVVADGYLIAVVSEHALREGSSTITAVPLSLLERDPAHPLWGPGVGNASEWWARLGVSGLDGLRHLPAPAEPKAEPSAGLNAQAAPRPRHPAARGRKSRLLVVEDQIIDDLSKVLDSEFDIVPVTSLEEWNKARDSLDVDGALIDLHLKADAADSLGTTVIADYLRKYTEIPAALMSVAPPPLFSEQKDLRAKYRLLEVVHKGADGKLNEAKLLSAAWALVDAGEKARRARLELWVESDLFHFEDDHAYNRRQGAARLKGCQKQAENLLRRLKKMPIGEAEQAVKTFHEEFGPRAWAATP